MVIRRGFTTWMALTIVAVVLAGCDTRAPAVRRVLLDREVPVPELAAAKFDFSTADRGYLLVEVSQEGTDVQVELRAGGQRLLFDAPGRRAGPERGCMFAPAGAFEVRVTPRDGPGPGGNHARVVISSESADEAAAPDSALAAECLEAHGGADHEQWKTADLAAQLADYVSAGETWERHGKPARAAMARLQAAWLVSRHMPRSDANVSKSAALGGQARDGFRALEDCVGASHAAVQLAVPGAQRASDLAKRGATAEAAAAFTAVKRDLLAAIDCYERAGHGYFAAEAYNSLGSVSHYSGDAVAALSQLAESAARFRSISELGGARRALSNASIVRSASGQYREAARGFDELLATGGSEAADDALADILDSSATTHVAVGNYDKALGELLQSSAIHENSQDLGGLARSLNGFAFAYLSIGDAGAARDYAQRAVSVRERLAPEDRGSTESEQIMSLLIEGNAQRQLGDLPAAIVAHQRALRLSRADSLGVQARLELARDRLRQRAPAEALRLLAEAAAKVKTTWGTLAAQIELERARSHAMSGTPELARKVLEQLKGRFGAAGQPTLEIEVLQQLAAAQLAQGSRAAARRTSAECIARLEELRLATVNPMFRARLVATHRAAYELEVEMLLADHASASEPAARTRILTEILAASDAARAGLVRELATAAPSKEASGADAEVRELAAEIALQEYLLQQAEYGITLADGGAPLRERLGDLRARFDSITARVAPAGAGYTAAQYSWRDIAPDTAVLSFVHSSAGLRRFLFTNDGALELPVVATQPVTAALGALLADVTGTRDRETPALEVISRLLLPSGPTLGGKRRWIIVADSATSAVPFAGLEPRRRLPARHPRPRIVDGAHHARCTAARAQWREAARRRSRAHRHLRRPGVFSARHTRQTRRDIQGPPVHADPAPRGDREGGRGHRRAIAGRRPQGVRGLRCEPRGGSLAVREFRHRAAFRDACHEQRRMAARLRPDAERREPRGRDHQRLPELARPAREPALDRSRGALGLRYGARRKHANRKRGGSRARLPRQWRASCDRHALGGRRRGDGVADARVLPAPRARSRRAGGVARGPGGDGVE